MSASTFATRICRWWVGRYTRSCPVEVARSRRAEIESDLWEHHADATRRGVSSLAHDVDVLRRVLSGVPADLSWRREKLRSRERLPSRGVPVMSRTRQLASTATALLAGVAVLPATTLWALLGADDNGGLTRNEWLWIVSASLLGLLLLVGMVLRLREEAPRLGTGLLLLGAPAPAVAWFWFPPLYVLSLAVFLLALFTHPRPAPPTAAL